MTEAGIQAAATSKEKTQAQGPTPCLVFADRAEEAVNFYVSLFNNSKVLSVTRGDGNGLIPEGKLMHASFQLDGRVFTAFDGGPSFSFSDGISLMVTCETQEEIDRLWTQLTDGGEEGPCGWLKDRFGVSWQVVPVALGEMLGDSEHGNSAKAVEAMLKMKKLDIDTLRQAYRSGS
ncbi:MAG: VOC family protein [Candidatus Dormibacteraeota bacterium]|nr:VOC family protein [Candidatus Dormibacteraeota bacterium]